MVLKRENEDITFYLHRWSKGDQDALEQIAPFVYEQLLLTASRKIARERADFTLTPGELVSETFIRLLSRKKLAWVNRQHFYAVATLTMGDFLAEYARGNHRLKRKGGWLALTLDENLINEPENFNLLQMGIDALTKKDSRKAMIVQLKVYGGLTNEEVGAHLCISTSTVKRDWDFSKAWLGAFMAHDTEG